MSVDYRKHRAAQQIDEYCLVEHLGSGRTCEVWKARDDHRDTYALKLFHEQYEHLAHSEGITLSKLSHPGIVQLKANHASKGYLVLESHSGQTLRDVLNEHTRLGYSRAGQLALGLAQALAHSHERGVAHGDLKPENILIAWGDRPILCDWSRTTRMDEGLEDSLDPYHAPLGTIPYLSPEQREGEAPSAQSDVYQLGVIFHEMLTGRRAKAPDEVGVGNTDYVPATLLKLIEKHMLCSRPQRRMNAGSLARTLERKIMPAVRTQEVSKSGRLIIPKPIVVENALGCQSSSDFREAYAEAVQQSTRGLRRAAGNLAAATLGIVLGSVAIKGISTPPPALIAYSESDTRLPQPAMDMLERRHLYRRDDEL